MKLTPATERFQRFAQVCAVLEERDMNLIIKGGEEALKSRLLEAWSRGASFTMGATTLYIVQIPGEEQQLFSIQQLMRFVLASAPP